MSAKPSDKDTQTITAKRLRRIDTTAYDNELDKIVDSAKPSSILRQIIESWIGWSEYYFSTSKNLTIVKMTSVKEIFCSEIKMKKNV